MADNYIRQKMSMEVRIFAAQIPVVDNAQPTRIHVEWKRGDQSITTSKLEVPSDGSKVEFHRDNDNANFEETASLHQHPSDGSWREDVNKLVLHCSSTGEIVGTHQFDMT